MRRGVDRKGGGRGIEGGSLHRGEGAAMHDTLTNRQAMGKHGQIADNDRRRATKRRRYSQEGALGRVIDQRPAQHHHVQHQYCKFNTKNRAQRPNGWCKGVRVG